MFKKTKRVKKSTRRRQHREHHAYDVLENRRCMASVGWDGVGQGAADLTYYIGDAPEGMQQAEFEQTIETALKAWSDVVDVSFTETKTPGLHDSLDFTFANLDGEGGTLARAYLPDDLNRPQIAGDVQFDSSENWEVGNDLGRQAYDLLYVAVHEIGHSLGLLHNSAEGAVLGATVSSQQYFTGLSQHDIDDVRKLYSYQVDPATTVTQTFIDPHDSHTHSDHHEGPVLHHPTDNHDEPDLHPHTDHHEEPDVQTHTDHHEEPREVAPEVDDDSHKSDEKPRVFGSGRFRFVPTGSWSGRTIYVSVDPAIFRQLFFISRLNYRF